MEQNYKKNGFLNWITLLVTAGCGFFFAKYAGSSSGIMGSIYLGLGFMVALVSYIQMRLAERESLEQLEFEELKRAKGDSTLFAEASSDTFPAKRSRQQFDRFLVPAFTFLLFCLQLTAAYWGWNEISAAEPPLIDEATITMALFGLAGLVLFLLGKFSTALARLNDKTLLRPGGSYLMLGAFICFGVAVAEGAAFFEFPKFDYYFGKTLCVILVLVAIENLLSLIFEIYRPRVATEGARTLYESRLIGLLGQPQGIVTTVAQALDYQFGFKVSETWFYQFLEKALAKIILAQLAVLFVTTMVVIIDPHEKAVVERFGRPVGGGKVLEPGFHLKLPWPISKIYRFPTEEIQKFNVGFTERAPGMAPGEHEGGDHDDLNEKVLLWTRSHYLAEEMLLVASREQAQLNDESGAQAVPVNMITASVTVHFLVKDLIQWTYNHADAAAVLNRLAFREVVKHLVSVDIMDIMSSGRIEAARHLREKINQAAEERELGVEITFVGLQDIHPPVKVADAYEAVINAEQEKEAKIYQAKGYALETEARAAAEAAQIVDNAKAEAVRKVSEASAFADSLTSRLAAYQASPQVFKERTYYESLGELVATTRKYVIGVTNAEEVIIMNLEDKLRADLLDVSVPE